MERWVDGFARGAIARSSYATNPCYGDTTGQESAIISC